MKCGHCGTLCGHNVYLDKEGNQFCSRECAEKYDSSQTTLNPEEDR